MDLLLAVITSEIPHSYVMLHVRLMLPGHSESYEWGITGRVGPVIISSLNQSGLKQREE